MDIESAKREVKQHLEEVLQQRGINTGRNFYCLNPEHDNTNTEAMGYDPRALKAHCFSCGASYDTMDVIGLEYGYTDLRGKDRQHYMEILKEACDRFNIPLDDSSRPSTTTGKAPTRTQQPQQTQPPRYNKSKEETAHERIQEARRHIEEPVPAAYLQTRGISMDTAKKYGLGYLPSLHFGYRDEGGDYAALIIPNSEYSYMARNIETSEKGVKSTKLATQQPFNMRAIHEAETVYIVEGEINALSVIEAGGNAVALGSASYVRKFIAALREALARPSDPVVCTTLVLALDNDEAGLRAAQEVREGIHELQREGYSLKLKTRNISEPFNDPNEAWTQDPEGFAKAVREGAATTEEEYRKTSAAMKLTDFLDGISESANTPAISTGFPLLDDALDGGLYEGLYLIPAITSGGKTTLALQIADNIAAQGHDALYVSLEMAETELIAKSLSRQTFIQATRQGLDRANAKTNRGITNGRRWEHYSDTERKLIADALEAYSAYADHLYIREGLGNISVEEVRGMVEKHTEAMGKPPVLLIDYVQIMAPSDPRATDKTNMDMRVWGLKAISRDFKIPVIVLSSINRQNYAEAINLSALKESGALEYSSDTVLGLQLQGAGSREAKRTENWENERMSEDPRRMEVRVLKNRNGRRGASLYYDYYPMFNLFYERDHPARTWTMEED